MKFPTIIIMMTLIVSGCSSTPTVEQQSLDLRPLHASWTDGSDKGVPRAKLFADSVSIYAIAAYDVYDDSPILIEQIPFPKNEKWTQLLPNKGLEEDIGFAAKAWLRELNDQTKELVISYRGTDDFWKDFFNANLIFVKNPLDRTQFDAALEFAMAVKQAVDGINISKTIITGHSLGGGLAEYVQRLYPESMAVTFDTSPNQGRLYSIFTSKYDKNVIRVYEKGEILQYLRYALSPDLVWDEIPTEEGTRTIWYQFYNSNPLLAHGMRDLAISLIKVSALNNNASATSVLNQVKTDLKN
ncbi:Mbeg1-like protein [Paraglaciecola chathamensis]|uniref:Mbeg1-like protein n=1 Tax=Paraglaciecola chathamensis TaxID=368405 RepID=UPI0026F96218|nr:Mbeg1-like protein [Paraglaciecola chathamensis]MDO6560267.1 DUF2974 domain-containing protein [Paraglaciecola chathamensis]